ncbi:hypothetical protein FMUND_8946 [Fusarium mundagurra]|uniref:Uncharacterized protein n=1 Tax=Fusarium mundagurra TaxID=1567541 RepID=A0A8H6DBL0_9HYPO|nr:hypothetical protein FMUND_8946 [Fusarium mundagurra]
MDSLANQKHFLLALPPEIQAQIMSLVADSTDFKSVHSLLFSCKQLYAIALPFSVQTFHDIPRAEEPKEGSVVVSRIVQFLSYVSIVKPELAQHVQTIELHDWLTDDFNRGTVHIDANDLIFYKQLIFKILPQTLGYDSHYSSRWIYALEAGFEDAAVALLLAVCTNVKNLAYGHPRDPICFYNVILAAYGGCGRRRIKLPPSQLLTKLKNVKHESYNVEKGYREFYDHAEQLFCVPSIRSYECVRATSPPMDEFNIDPMDEACSSVQSIILRDSCCGRNIISQLEEFLNTLSYPDRFPDLAFVKVIFNEDWVNEEEIKSLATNRDGLVLELLSAIEPGWNAQDPPPQFEQYGEQFQPPLYCAANNVGIGPKSNEERAQMIVSLLRHGSDPYQEFPQALYCPDRSSKPRAPFPGEDPPCTSYPEFPIEANTLDWKREDQHPHFSDDEWENEETVPAWGVRHIIHAIIEDGGFLKPFIDYPGFLESLDLEHRDPQGRTLLLSACRSAVGADVLAKTCFNEVHWKVENASPTSKIYPSWDRDVGPTESDFSEPGMESLVEIFLRLGADPLAVDYQGKNALHHLLVEVCNKDTGRFHRLPMVRRSLRIFASRYPSLVNQPDKHGTYPLHAALRRMRLYPDFNYYTTVKLGEPLGCVQEMLRMGADPRAKDRKGNTAIHYLADDDLTGVCQDINMPNTAGRTVAEFIFDDNGRMEDDKMGNHGECSRNPDDDFRDWQDVDSEVFTALDDAGINWRAKTSEGGNLLHLVARSGLSQERLIWRSRFLVGKGIDPTAPDADGWTARKIAEHYRLNKFLFYEELRRLEMGEVEVESQ